jgi:hypothetical protein
MVPGHQDYVVVKSQAGDIMDIPDRSARHLNSVVFGYQTAPGTGSADSRVIVVCAQVIV